MSAIPCESEYVLKGMSYLSGPDETGGGVGFNCMSYLQVSYSMPNGCIIQSLSFSLTCSQLSDDLKMFCVPRDPPASLLNLRIHQSPMDSGMLVVGRSQRASVTTVQLESDKGPPSSAGSQGAGRSYEVSGRWTSFICGVLGSRDG